MDNTFSQYYTINDVKCKLIRLDFNILLPYYTWLIDP